MGIIIVFNSGTMGLETEYRKLGQQTPAFVEYLELFMLICYTVELALRVYAKGIEASSKDSWMQFDTLIVTCGWLSQSAHYILGKGSATALDKVVLIRLMRLVRVCRVIRLMSKFKTLWILVQGLIQCIETLFWTLIIVSLLIYAFAVVACELINEDFSAGEDYNNVVEEHFNSLGGAILTLVQGFTLDSFADIYRPLIFAKPYLLVYFAGYILLLAIALMNLISAVMIESALDQASKDKELFKALDAAKKKAHVEKLKEMFSQIDEDHSTTVSLAEFENMDEEIKKHLSAVISYAELVEIFSVLDRDSVGELGIQDLCEGILKATQDKPTELYGILKQGAETHCILGEVHDLCQELHIVMKNLGVDETGPENGEANPDTPPPDQVSDTSPRSQNKKRQSVKERAGIRGQLVIEQRAAKVKSRSKDDGLQ